MTAPSPDYMLPPKSEHCEACGKPRDDGPVWMLEHLRWEHAACRDWSRHAFPYDWKLNHLRLLARALKRSFALTVRVGLLLKNIRARWPAHAREGFAELARKESALDESLRKLRDRSERG